MRPLGLILTLYRHGRRFAAWPAVGPERNLPVHRHPQPVSAQDPPGRARCSRT
ncbi:MAG: hypothetical protein MZV70_63150 [Desulfobacterales bacterium]|nr:hypothetical protein [Desulfobacterales bacterium]